MPTSLRTGKNGAVVNGDLDFITLRAVVRECCKDDDASQLRNGKFDPQLARSNSLTDHHQKLLTWLGPGYLPTRKIKSWSLKGFLFPSARNCASKMFTRLFSL